MILSLTRFAETSANCTINGRECSASEAAGLSAFFLVFGVFLLVLFVWWIVTLIHVFSHQDVPNRVLWIVLHFIGLGWLAAPIYYFAVMRPYNKHHSAQPIAPAQPYATMPTTTPMQPAQPVVTAQPVPPAQPAASTSNTPPPITQA